MTDPALELLAAVVKAAREDLDVIAIFGGEDKVAVWDQAPTADADIEGSDGYPFIEVPSVQVIGEEPVEGMSLDDDGETITDDQSEAYVTVGVFSRLRPDGQGGKPEAMAFTGALRKALGRELEVTGFHSVLGHFRDARHFTESDGLTAHSVLTFRYLLQPA